MSEKSKGDTSSASTLAQIKNNPLLSASVTGMLLDDFPNKPLLLPAAPPIVTTVSVPENPSKSSPTVTVGETPVIDTDQFSEINLNTSSDGPIQYSLQSDINDNPFPQIQHEPPTHSPSEFADESILSQAASSFSQLPSVASTVLSTFSKVINNYTPTSQATSRETSSERDSLQNTQQQQQEQFGSPSFVTPTSFATSQIDPPTFFTPTEYANQPKTPTSGPQLPPPLTIGAATTGNTYRLTTKKKTYAQIPGLSKQLEQNIPENNFLNQQSLPSKLPNTFETGDNKQIGYPSQPISLQQSTVPTEFPQTINSTNRTGENNFGQNTYPIPQVTPFQQQANLEDTTSKGNSLFSLSNIVPPVLQNITGFVKSTVSGSSEPVKQQTFYQQDQPQSSINFFDNTLQQPVASAAAGFTIPEVNSNTPVNYFVPTEVNSEPVLSGPIGFESLQPSVNPPPLQTAPPKPPQAAGTSSFRLQKGTRLYKSAFEQSPAPSAPSIHAAFSLQPTVTQPPQTDIFNPPVPQTSTNFNPPPAVLTGLPPLPQTASGNNFITPINVTSSFIEPNKQQELGQVPLFNPINNQHVNLAPSANIIPQTNTFFNPTTQEENTFILPAENRIPDTTQIFNPLNQQQNIHISTDNQVPPTTAVFDPVNQVQKSSISSGNLASVTTELFNPLNLQQNIPEPTESQGPEISQFFNSFNPPLLVSSNKQTDSFPANSQQQISAAITESPPTLPIQTLNQQTELYTGVESDKSFKPQVNTQVSQAAIFNPSQEIQSAANFFQSNSPIVNQSPFFGLPDNPSQNLSSIPNFPPPPVEKPEPKEDQYDSVPLQPPSIDQKPVEPLIKKTSQLSDFQPTQLTLLGSSHSPIGPTKPPIGPPQPPIGTPHSQEALVRPPQPPIGPPQPAKSNQQGSNPFRRSSGLNNKLPKTVTPPPPTILPTQFSESSQSSPVNFFNPQQQFYQSGGDTNISEDIIIANTIDFPPVEISDEIKSISNNFNIASPENTEIKTSIDPVSSENIQSIENLQKNTTDLIKNLETEKEICTQIEDSHQTPKEHIRKDSSSLSNYFGNISESRELNNFGNIISSTANIIPPGPATIPIIKQSDFENQLQNTFNNNDNIHKSYQSENSPITNFFSTNNQKEINQQLIQSTISSSDQSEENYNNTQKSTPEKLEKSKQNLFTNYFTSINNQQQQNQNIEKQTDFLNSANLIGNSKQTAPNLPKTDPSTFFDSFNNNNSSISLVTDEFNQTQEDPNSQRIQNFFNNPPPQNLGDSINDLNYNFYGNNNQDIVEIKKGLLTATTTNTNNNNNNNIEINRPLTPASNLVEPPSSACSEFSSDFNNSVGGQQQQILDNLKKVSADDLPEEIVEQLNMAKLIPGSSANQKHIYQPVKYHWFFKKSIDAKQIWTPFSHKDSNALEDSFQKGDGGLNIIPVEGGRYDVDIKQKTRIPVYWNGDSSEVRRCSWFYKAIDSKYVPYDEITSDILEEEYKNASNSGEWHKKIALETGETVVFHGPTVIVHFLQSQIVDAWGGATQSQSRPRVVKRDLDDFVIDDGETNKVDHLLFMVHGIGSGCDLKFRSVEEVVEEFRSIAYQLVQSHYKNSRDLGEVGRVEVLPVSWHDELHSKESGIDEKLKAITLESIPRLRNFANDTVLDVLFYTSPVFCQSIINTVANCMNRVYLKYCQRNTNFNGQVSLAGHSLGSLILFDLLCHQKPIEDNEIQNSENPDQMIGVMPHVDNQISNNIAESGFQKQVSYTIGSAGTGQPFINYPQLLFAPKKFFALGSPVGMFVTIRGIDSLGLDFKLPTCPGFYNIFHPYDPVAYRVEALINPELSAARPVLIPHHKGRKRMHLELKETMTRVGTEVKQKIVETFKNTVESVFFMTPKSTKTETQEIEEEVDKVLELQLKIEEQSSTRLRTESQSSNVTSEPEAADIDLPLGKLNDSKRIDYVLQEAPLEFFNEYLFALTSHVCYWESADTILFVVKEIYSSLGITTDSQIPQQTMTIERPNSISMDFQS